MAASSLNILSGILSAVAGFSGDTVSKNGTIPGLDLASIVPALLGNKAGGGSGLLGTIASVASKTGLLKNVNLGNLAELAGSLFSTSGTAPAPAKKASGGIAGLASAIMGNSGKGADLASIAKMALSMADSAKSPKEVNGMATDLGKTLSSAFGVSFNGSGTALKALGNVVGDSTKSGLLQSVLKGLM